MISVRVREYLNTKYYLTNQEDFEDQVDEKYLLNECYGCLLLDLKEMGVLFHCDIEEILSNFYDAENILNLTKLVSPNYLYRLFKANPELCITINSLIDDNEDTSQVLPTLLECLYEIYPNDDFYNRLYTEIGNKVYNEVEFTEHLSAIIESINDEIPIPEIDDPEAAVKFAKSIEGTIKAAQKVFDYAISNYEGLPVTKLYKDLRLYNVDKIRPDRINKYTWWYENRDNNDLPKELIAFRDKLVYEHNVENNHHIEYYEALPKGQKIGRYEFLNLLGNLYDPDDAKSKAHIKKEITDIYNKLDIIHEIEEGTLQFIYEIIEGVHL